jgi:hypothetical protein
MKEWFKEGKDNWKVN